MSELKPCPFCGEEPEIFDFTDGRFIVQCSNSDCDVYPYTKIHHDKADAITAWNQRATVYTKPTTLSQLQAENAKLRELLHRLLVEYRYLRVRPRKMYLQHEGRMRAIEKEMRELGVEVD